MQARVIFKEVNWQEVRISRSGSTSGQKLGLRREGMERIKQTPALETLGLCFLRKARTSFRFYRICIFVFDLLLPFWFYKEKCLPQQNHLAAFPVPGGRVCTPARPALWFPSAAVTLVVSGLNWNAGRVTLWAAFKSKVSKVEKSAYCCHF